jgi:microcystin-dependent protein
LNYNDRLPEAVMDAIMEYISTMYANFIVTQVNSTTLQIVAGADNAQVAVGINGRWRWNSATVNAAHPGGAAATYDIYVTASDNSFAPSGLPAGSNPEIDSTVYSFALAIRAAGSPPATALYRKIGTCVWDGAAITDFAVTVGFSRHHVQHDPGGSDPLNWPAIAQVMQLAGTIGARPAASVANNGFTYLATDQNGGTYYRSNGAAWVQQSAAVVHAALHLPGGADAIAWDASVHARGTIGARPAAAAGNQGLFYLATDVAGGTLYRSTGSAWEAVAAGVTAALAPAAHAASHAPGGTDALPWASIHGYGTLGARPSAVATNVGYLYYATDTSTIYRSNGTTWDSESVSVAAINQAGTLAARPGAATVPAGTEYLATDDHGGTKYRSDGAVWTKESPSVNGEWALGTVAEWPWAAGSIPAYTVLPYGQLLTAAAFPDMQVLADAAGRPYGGVAGTNFNTPDYRGRVGVGKDDMGGSAANRITVAVSGVSGATLGAVFGAEGITLTTGQLPAHNHGVTGAPSLSDPGHGHGNITNDLAQVFYLGNAGSQNTSNTVDDSQGTTAPGPARTAVVGTGVTTGVGTLGTANAGSGSAHQNTQPSIIVNKLMRVL